MLEEKGLRKINRFIIDIGITFLVSLGYFFLISHHWRLLVLGFSDESRHLMDAVFVSDFIKDLPVSILHPIKYTINYYLHYPALSIFLYYPPVFAVICGVIFLVFGMISLKVAFFVIAGFGIVCCWIIHLLIKGVYGELVAFLSISLIFSNFVIVMWGRKVMLEMPTLCMIVITIYFLVRYLQTNKYRNYCFTILFATLSFFTKQPAIFVWGLIFGIMIFKERLGMLRWKFLIPGGIGIVFILCYIIILLYFSRFFIQTASSVPIVKAGKWGLLFKGYDFYPKLIWNSFPKVVSVGLCLGILSSLYREWKKRNGQYLVMPLWVLCFYIVNLMIIRSKGVRYIYFLIPPIYILSVYGWMEVGSMLKRRWQILGRVMVSVVFIIVIITQVFTVLEYNPYVRYMKGQEYIKGYKEAARFVVENFEGKTVLFDGWYDGNFIYYIRRFDTARKIKVLRGSKVLVSFATFKRIWYKELVKKKRDIIKLIKGYNIKYIVVEEKDVFESFPLQLLREMLAQDSKFKLVKTIPITTNITLLKDTNILIYKYVGKPGFKYNYITIPFQGVGKNIRVKI